MRIESVEVVQLASEIAGSQAFVQITTDTGTRGLGQSAGWGSAGAVAALVDEFAPLLVGADPYRIEHLWQLLWRVRPFRGNYLAAAVSAVDIALWDIKGKALGVPVWQLLGGNTRERIRLHLLLSETEPGALADHARRAAEQGYTAVKFDPLGPDSENLALPALVDFACGMGAAAREAVGRDVDIIFELHRKLDPARALVVANALARFEPLFIEDPVQIDSVDVQAETCRRIDAPVATGERLSSPWEFGDLLSHHAPIHVRPDVGLAGGLTGCRKIAALAEARHCGIVPHNFLGPGLTAPSAHLCATVPNLVTMEYSDRDESPDGPSRALTTALVRDGGFLRLPDVPGLGVELKSDAVDIAPPTPMPLSADGMLRRDGSVAASV